MEGSIDYIDLRLSRDQTLDRKLNLYQHEHKRSYCVHLDKKY